MLHTMTELALHPDGRVFVTEEEWNSTDLIAFEGQTGGTSGRWRLAQSNQTAGPNVSTV